MTQYANEHRKVYSAIHEVVLLHPRLQNTISSIRSWIQNTGPTFAANLLKLFVMIGSDNGSLEESNITFSGSIFFCGFIGGVSTVGPVAGTVCIDPMMTCGIKVIGAVNAKDPGA